MHDAICNVRAQQQRRVRSQVRDSDAYVFFNLLTGPELFDKVESLLPAHRERLFPPTETLSMFLAQTLSSGSFLSEGGGRGGDQASGRRTGAVQHEYRGVL